MTVTVSYTFVNDENSELIMGKVAKAIEQIVKEVNNKDTQPTTQPTAQPETCKWTSIGEFGAVSPHPKSGSASKEFIELCPFCNKCEKRIEVTE